MTCNDWVSAIDHLLNQFSIVIPILLASFIIRLVRLFFK